MNLRLIVLAFYRLIVLSFLRYIFLSFFPHLLISRHPFYFMYILSLLFLVADTRLYKPLFVPLVSRSVGPSQISFSPLLPTRPRLMLPCIRPCFWAAAPKGRCPVGHRGEPLHLSDNKSPHKKTSQASNSHPMTWEIEKMQTDS